MIDWNGNRKIDPVDVGIELAVNDRESTPGNAGENAAETEGGSGPVGSAGEAPAAKRMPGPKARRFVVLLGVVLVLLAAGLAIWAYLGDYYRADAQALEGLNSPHPDYTIQIEDNDKIVFAPEDPVAGLVFYPGGKVQYQAYAPLMQGLAEQGILCVLVHMPANLAVFGVNRAEGIPAQYPGVADWYIGGHSLGGSMAASYVAKHTGEYQGLVLLAAYSTVDLQESGLKVLTVYGTEDGVLNRDSYEKYRTNLPPAFTEIIIPGGCHAYFGAYGPQDGDGTPTITREEQLRQTVEAVAALVGGSCT